MSKPILIVRLKNNLTKEQLTNVNQSVSKTLNKEYFHFIVFDSNIKSDIEFQVLTSTIHVNKLNELKKIIEDAPNSNI